MKRSVIMLTLAFVCFNFASIAQKYQRTTLCFNITDANNNGKDNSSIYIQNMAYVSFYQDDGDSVLRMAVVFQKDNTSSYGNLYQHPMKITNELYEGKKTEKNYYQWFFKNSYDEKSGWANVELSTIYDRGTPRYMIKIITMEDFQILIYKGSLNKGLTGKLTKIED